MIPSRQTNPRIRHTRWEPESRVVASKSHRDERGQPSTRVHNKDMEKVGIETDADSPRMRCKDWDAQKQKEGSNRNHEEPVLRVVAAGPYRSIRRSARPIQGRDAPGHS